MLKRILISTSNPADAAQLIVYLAEELFEVEWQPRGRVATDRHDSDRFDAVIVGEVMNDMPGLSFCHQIRLSDATVPIMFLCEGTSHQDRVVALSAGADDCMGRPYDLEELSARIHALLRRSEVTRADGGHNVGSMKLDHSTRKISCHGGTIDLSTKEFDLLLYMASRPHRVITRDEILFDVWGPSFDGNANVVEVYIGYLRRKLSRGSCEHRIETIRGSGYRYVVGGRGPAPSSHSGKQPTENIAPGEETEGSQVVHRATP